MIEHIELLERKLNTSNKESSEKISYRLNSEYGISPTAQDELGSFLHALKKGAYPQNKAYDFLYKFIDFYYDDEDYLSDYADIIIYAVSEGIIDPIDGSRLIGAIWAVIGYQKELVEFIGFEGEVEARDNRLKESNLDKSERQAIEEELSNIRLKLITIAKEIVKNNIF